MGEELKFKPKQLLSLLFAYSFCVHTAHASTCFHSIAAGNTVIEEVKLRADTATFRLGIEDLNYLGDSLSPSRKAADGSPLYPEMHREFDEAGMVVAGTLKRWRNDTFSSLINMDEAQFNKILGDAIDFRRNDAQFSSSSRQDFLHAIDSWINAKKKGDLAVQKITEDRILAETIGKSKEKDGVDFQAIQADFRNAMTIDHASELRSRIPSVAMPVILSAFLYRNFRNHPDPRLSDNEGSIGVFVNQYMLPAPAKP